MGDDVIYLLVVSAVVGHLSFLQFNECSVGTELLNEPDGAVVMRFAVWYTGTKLHLLFYESVSGVRVERGTVYNGLFLAASRQKYEGQKDDVRFMYEGFIYEGSHYLMLVSLTEVWF